MKWGNHHVFFFTLFLRRKLLAEFQVKMFQRESFTCVTAGLGWVGGGGVSEKGGGGEGGWKDEEKVLSPWNLRENECCPWRVRAELRDIEPGKRFGMCTILFVCACLCLYVCANVHIWECMFMCVRMFMCAIVSKTSISSFALKITSQQHNYNLTSPPSLPSPLFPSLYPPIPTSSPLPSFPLTRFAKKKSQERNPRVTY